MASSRSARALIVNGICIVAIAGLAGWAISRRADMSQRVAEGAVDRVLDRAADEASGIAGGILGDNGDSAAAPANPREAIERLVNLGRSMSRMGNDVLDGLMGLSAEEEKKIGREAHELVAQNHRLIPNSPALGRIRRLAEPFLAGRRRPEITCQFFVVDDAAVNAFAHLGGYVYINQGLLDLVRRDEELAFVLGHEIAHGDLRHCVKGMTAAIRARELGGDLAGNLAAVAYQAIALGYSEDQEFESDDWSYEQMIASGWSHTQALSGLRMLERQFGHDGGHEDSSRPIAVEVVEDHLRTHPPVDQRIERLQRRLKPE